VLILKRGSLEIIQNSISKILGLATKTILEEAIATAFYSFFSDLKKNKSLRQGGEDRVFEEISYLINDMGLGRIRIVSKDTASQLVNLENGFNSGLNELKSVNSCFQADGLLEAMYRMAYKRDAKADEVRCKSVGNSDIDQFSVKILEEKQQFTYIESESAYTKQENTENIELTRIGSIVKLNGLDSEIIPAVLFPYLFSKLRRLIGPGVYGIERETGFQIAKHYAMYDMNALNEKYGLSDFEALSPMIGAGKINSTKNEDGTLKELDIYDSFNALYADDLEEKRCSLLLGLLSGISFRLLNVYLTFTESDCSSINNQFCRIVLATK
jgi:predicted hydrocarbon binding protein